MPEGVPVALRRMNSIWPQLEPLLAKVQKPARYIGCEDGTPGPRPPSRSGRLAAHLSRHLRDRPAQPGPADPLRDPQRAPRCAWPSGPTPRGSTSRRSCAPHGLPLFSVDTPPSGRRLRPAGLQPLGRAGLHQRPQLHRPGRGAGAGRRAPAPSTRWWWPAATAPTTPSRWPTSSTSSCWATARRWWREITEVVGRLEGRGAHRGLASERAARAVARRRACTCPSMYEATYDGEHLVAVDAPLPRRARAGREAHRRRPGRLALPQAASSCRSPRWSTTGSTSRSSGAAPGAAASARRA